MRRLLALMSVMALMVAALAMPAAAQPVVIGGGLVNVTLVDVVDVNNNTVQVPIAVAANICDVNVAVLVQEFQDDGTADCDATAESIASRGPGQGGGQR